MEIKKQTPHTNKRHGPALISPHFNTAHGYPWALKGSQPLLLGNRGGLPGGGELSEASRKRNGKEDRKPSPVRTRDRRKDRGLPPRQPQPPRLGEDLPSLSQHCQQIRCLLF